MWIKIRANEISTLIIGGLQQTWVGCLVSWSYLDIWVLRSICAWNTYSASAAESTEYNFKHTPGVGAHVGKVHTGIPRCTRHKGAHSGSYCPEYKQTPERGQVQGYWSLTGSLLAISTELREAVLLCHAVTLCCTLRYKMMPLTD